MAKMEEFLTSMLAALEDPAVVEHYRLIFEPIFRELLDPVTHKLSETVQALTTKVSSLQAQSNAKDEKIASLQKEVGNLQVLVDNHEQHGRRDSIRIFGLSESTPGTTDDKVLRLCNVRMKLQPPLTLEEIFVFHRVGKPPEPPDDGTPAPRPLLVKFATRRAKNRVMVERKRLRNQPTPRGGDDNSDAGSPQGPLVEPDEDPPRSDGEDDGGLNSNSMNWPGGNKIFISDDLTKARANLAYQARQARRQGSITETWIYESRVIIKDKRSRTH